MLQVITPAATVRLNNQAHTPLQVLSPARLLGK